MLLSANHKTYDPVIDQTLAEITGEFFHDATSKFVPTGVALNKLAILCEALDWHCFSKKNISKAEAKERFQIAAKAMEKNSIWNMNVFHDNFLDNYSHFNILTHMKSKNSGFTLIELLIVIFLFAVMIGAGVAMIATAIINKKISNSYFSVGENVAIDFDTQSVTGKVNRILYNGNLEIMLISTNGTVTMLENSINTNIIRKVQKF